jgi:hypothetical protein
MALVIELIENAIVVDGVEAWWDDVERAIHAEPTRFPTLRRIDPYGDVVVSGDDLTRLSSELDALLPVPSIEHGLITRLRALTARAVENTGAQLRSRGD